MNYILSILLSVQFVTLGIDAQELPQGKILQEQGQGAIESKKFYPELNITELVLTNGMKVLLKPTNEDEDELHVRLFARGGYASFPNASHALADAAVLTGVESGIGGLTSEQLSVYLYESSIDFLPKVEANCRTIDGSMPSDALDDYLMLLNAYFLEHNFDAKEFERALETVNSALVKEQAYASAKHQIALFQMNEGKTQKSNSGAQANLTQSQFALAKEINEQSFSNPEEFFCIIVGDFSPENVEPSIAKLLGTIQPQSKAKVWTAPNPIDFPSNIVNKVIHTRDRNDCIVRLTFPVESEMSPESMPVFKLACRVVERRLNQMALYDGSAAISANVQDELPLYPSLDTVWMSVQFRCNHKDAERLVKNVVSQVKRLHDEGPFPSEVEEMRRAHVECRASWMGCNEFWLMAMTNYSLWGAELGLILEEPLGKGVVYEKVKNFLQYSIRVDRYTTVSAVP